MKYELRSWYEDRSCLYTDDPRVKDLAVLSPDLMVVSSYFKTTRAQQPFAWDIVGASDVVSGIFQRFSGHGARVSRRA
jgi:hypothetical protein